VEECKALDAGGTLPDGCWEEMLQGLEFIEKTMGKALGRGLLHASTFRLNVSTFCGIPGVAPVCQWAKTSQVDLRSGGVEEWKPLALGDPADPLLLSVRSGAAISMPGRGSRSSTFPAHHNEWGIKGYELPTYLPECHEWTLRRLLM
jgi:hypothetical protein